MAEKGLALVVYNEEGKQVPFFATEELKVNDKVVVENDSCLFLGRVVGFTNEHFEEKPSMIVRKATKEDKNKFEKNKEKSKSALQTAKEKVRKFNLDMKLISAQYCLDCSKIVFTFVSENRIDFRALVKELANIFKVRIELKQIGSRDECKVVGGLGVCGKMCCCKEFLPDFAKVSIKMAKNQNLSLNPQKINGLCGRLMCCLSYENEAYTKILSKMPKQGSEVETKDGKGTAIYNDILGESVSVKVFETDGSYTIKDYPLKEIKVNTYAAKE